MLGGPPRSRELHHYISFARAPYSRSFVPTVFSAGALPFAGSAVVTGEPGKPREWRAQDGTEHATWFRHDATTTGRPEERCLSRYVCAPHVRMTQCSNSLRTWCPPSPPCRAERRVGYIRLVVVSRFQDVSWLLD